VGSSRAPTAGLAEKLLTIRNSFDFSQAQMVDRLKEQNLPSTLTLYAGNISRFEQGLREPPLLVLLAYARAAGVGVEVLIDAELELPNRFARSIDIKPKRRAAKSRTQKSKATKKTRGSTRT
jgi:transcriptional regulator with XRE-family HTH domain